MLVYQRVAYSKDLQGLPPPAAAKLRHQGGLADDAGSHTQAHDRRHIPADADPMAMLLSENFYHILGYTWIYWVIWCIYIYINYKHIYIYIIICLHHMRNCMGFHPQTTSKHHHHQAMYRLLSSPAEWLGPNQCAGTCQNTPGTDRVAATAALPPLARCPSFFFVRMIVSETSWSDKMTHKNPLCSGLKATHFVWEIRWGMVDNS